MASTALYVIADGNGRLQVALPEGVFLPEIIGISERHNVVLYSNPPGMIPEGDCRQCTGSPVNSLRILALKLGI